MTLFQAESRYRAFANRKSDKLRARASKVDSICSRHKLFVWMCVQVLNSSLRRFQLSTLYLKKITFDFILPPKSYLSWHVIESIGGFFPSCACSLMTIEAMKTFQYCLLRTNGKEWNKNAECVRHGNLLIVDWEHVATYVRVCIFVAVYFWMRLFVCIIFTSSTDSIRALTWTHSNYKRYGIECAYIEF